MLCNQNLTTLQNSSSWKYWKSHHKCWNHKFWTVNDNKSQFL